jgi:hypothetical protein
MSKLALKSEKIKMPESFESIEAKELTQNEQDKISRKLILRWYNGKKFEKLKALQQKVIEASYSEREELKRTIIENTKKELEQHKELTKDEIERRSEKFADDIINVAEGRSDMALVARRYAIQQDEEEAFYRVMDGFVSKRNQQETLRKIAKNPQFASFLEQIKGNDPATAQRIEMAIKEGDYEKLQKIVEKQSGGKITKSIMNQFMALGALGEAPARKFTPFDTLNKALSYLDKFRHIGHGFVINQASEKMGIPFMLTIRFASWTLRDFRQMDDIMQRNKHLIEQKSKKTIEDNDRLVFIEHMNKARLALEEKISGDKNLQENFRKSLDIYLDSKKELSPRDKEEIKQAAQFEDLRLVQVFEYYFGESEKREQWMLKSASRIPTLLRAYKNTFGEQRLVKSTMLRYTARRLADRSITEFRLKAKNWRMDDILRGVRDIEGKIEGARAGTATQFEDLYKKAAGYKPNIDDITAKDRHLHKEILDQDRMLQKYSILVRKATQIMSDEAKKVIDAGRSLQAAQQSAGDTFLTKKLHQLPHISDQSLAAMGLDKAKRASYSGADLINAYTRRLVDVKTMEDVTRARFQVLADTIETNVAAPVSKAWQGKIEVAKGAMGREELKKQMQDISDKVSPHKTRYRLKTYGLPAIILGIEGYSLFTGKAKSHEVLWDLGEAAGGFVPFIGTALDIRGAITGTSLSGKKLSSNERWMYAGFAAVGLVADAAMFIGGIGLGIRAGLGGVRAGRRAVKAGSALADAKKLGGLRDVAYASELPFFQRQIAKAGGIFDKVRRADAAADALYSRKAIQQANEISKYNSTAQEAYKVSKIEDIPGMIQSAQKAGHTMDAANLRRLHDAVKGIDYLSALKSVDKGIDIPRSFLGRTWLRGKAAFLEIKGWLLSIGIPAKTLKEYENSFDIVEGAKKLKLSETNELQRLIKGKEAERIRAAEAYENYTTIASRHGQTGIDYAKVVDDMAKQKRKRIRLRGIKDSKKENLRRVEKLHTEGRASQSEVDAAKKALTQADDAIKESTTAYKDMLTQKKNLTGKLEAQGADSKAWKSDFDKASKNLGDIETGIIRQEDKIRAAEETIVSANSSRAMMAMEMETKATQMAKFHERASGVARTLQTAGIVSGSIWFLTSFKAGPAEQMQAAKKIVTKGGGAAIKAADYIFTEDHSGKPPIDQMVEGRVQKVRLRQELGNYVEKAEKRGVKPEEVLAKHWDSEEARELARRQGLYEKVQKLIADKKVVPEQLPDVPRAGLRDIATGDSAKKLREKLQ